MSASWFNPKSGFRFQVVLVKKVFSVFFVGFSEREKREGGKDGFHGVRSCSVRGFWRGSGEEGEEGRRGYAGVTREKNQGRGRSGEREEGVFGRFQGVQEFTGFRKDCSFFVFFLKGRVRDGRNLMFQAGFRSSREVPGFSREVSGRREEREGSRPSSRGLGIQHQFTRETEATLQKLTENLSPPFNP